MDVAGQIGPKILTTAPQVIKMSLSNSIISCMSYEQKNLNI